jgi:hypothetical protein
VHIRICLSLNFPMGFLQRDIREIEYAGSVSPNLSHCIVGVFHGITRLEPSFFPLGF